MANIKSAIKRAKRSLAQRNVNRRNKSELKVALKGARSSAGKGDAKATSKVLSDTYSALDRAVYKGVLHKNAAARHKQRLTKLLNAPPAPRTAGGAAKRQPKS